MKCAPLIFCLILSYVTISKCLEETETVSSADNDNYNDEKGYGFDVSFPIHNRVSDNYPWLQHNLDPETNPAPTKYQDMPIQTLGDRQSLYAKHLSECHDAFGKDKSYCDLFEYDRMLMNQRQPRSMNNYTKMGFEKVKASPEIIKITKTFWEKNKLKQKVENWGIGNTYTNNWKSPTYMVSVDDSNLRGSGGELKQSLYDEVETILEEWSGEELSPTSMYGIRVYKEGSVLLPHVDRLPLVISAMINVAQDVDEDWPVEIYDHDGYAHNVTLQPGDMLLFESHSAIHGRPFPLKGRYYAMMFVHFEPIGHVLVENPNNNNNNNNNNNQDLNEQYKQASEDRVGGQSAYAGGFPPYIQRESPEEQHWREQHPEGWKTLRTPSSSRKQKEESMFHKAASKGDTKTIHKAIKSAERTSPEKKQLINARDDHGWQPLHEGAANGHEEVVDLLVSNGADINARTHGGFGATALHLAQKTHGENHSVVRYLKKLGALNIGPEL